MGKHEDRDVEEALDRLDYKRAVDAIAERYVAPLHRFCYPYCRHETDDVVQTIFMHVCRDITSFSRKVSVRTWLYKIAYNRCMDHLRATVSKRSLHALLDDRSEADPESNPWSRVDKLLDEPARLRFVGMLLGECKPEVGVAIALRYFAGFTYQEMAEICNEQPATLQARVARAIQDLRKRLAEMGIDV